MNRLIYIIFCLSFFATSCIEPFDISDEVNEQIRTPVINGWISDFKNNYKIDVSRTVPINDELVFRPVTDARVFVKNSDGGSTRAVYDSEDQAYYLPSTFFGEQGKSYWVEVTFADGETFQSIPEQLRAAPRIENLYYGKELGRSPSLGNLKEVLLEVNDPEDERNFYLWITENLYHSPISPDSRLYTIEADYNFDGQNKEVFVNQASDRYSYSAILVRQLRLSRIGYRFFDLLNKLNDKSHFNSTGEEGIDPFSNGLFATPPISLEGNIFEQGNETNFGQGYFGVYGSSSASLTEGEDLFIRLRQEFLQRCSITLTNGKFKGSCGFFPTNPENTREEGWTSYLFQDQKDIFFHDIFFEKDGRTSPRSSLRTSNRNVKLESRLNKTKVEGEDDLTFSHENLYLLVKDDFTGVVDLEIEATNFLSSATFKLQLTVK